MTASRRAIIITTAALLLAAGGARADARADFARAIIRDDASTMTLLMLRGFDPNTRDDQGRPGLVAALHRDALQVVDVLLISPGVQLDLPSTQGETALMMACIKGHLGLVEKLIRRGAAVHREGWTPLHYAASADHARSVTIARLLLACGARVNAPSPNGSTALMLAAQYGSEDMVRALLAAGADPLLRNQRGLDARDFARLGGRQHMVDLLAAARQ